MNSKGSRCMLKSDKLYNSTSSLVAAISLIVLGILMVVGSDQLYIHVVHLFISVLLILGVVQFIRYFFVRQENNEKKITFTRSFINLLFCFLFSIVPAIPLSVLPILFGIYFLMNGVIKFIIYFIMRKERANGRIKELLAGVFYVGFGIPFLCSPLKNLSYLLIFLGIYIILLGVTYLFDFISAVLPRRVKRKITRKLRFTLPVLVEMVIPYQVLNEINYFLDKEQYDKPFIYEEKKSSETPDMEIFVHASKNGFNRLGHVDIWYQGRVISYGNYDDASMRFFTMIGDGVVFTAKKEDYIPFCISHSKKTLFGFGLRLTDAQKKNIEKYLNSLFDQLVEWYSPYEVALQKNKKVSKQKYKDYASCLYMATKAKFYKFPEGRFKNYFVLGVNCCLLADSIIGKSGSDLLKMSGIITPGTYYEYLNREFRKKNSMVISRTIYNAESVNKKHGVKEIFKGFSK
jgi:conserved hypothetical protein